MVRQKIVEKKGLAALNRGVRTGAGYFRTGRRAINLQQCNNNSDARNLVFKAAICG
jgi:hypothetical protein